MEILDLLPDGAIPLHGLMTTVGLLVYVIGSHALGQRRHPSAAIAWVMAILLLPELGVPLYLMFGTRKLPKAGRRAVTPLQKLLPDELAPVSMQRLGAAMAMPPVCAYQALAVHQDGRQAREALFRLVESARERLDVCTFILGRDAFGDALLDALAARARQGVQVRLLVDGVGTLMGGRRDFSGVRQAGVQVTHFVPPLRSPLQWPLRGRTNLRNHRKIVVADASQLWSGGRNLAGEYFEGRDGGQAWLDLSFDLQGALASQAAAIFDADWSFARRPDRAWVDLGARHAWPAPGSGGPVAQLLPSGPDYADDTVHTALLTACYQARQRILIVTPYLVPDENLLSALALAARRGVQVDFVVPERSNHRLADIARQRPMRDLARAGARLWLAAPMMHAKAVIVDERMAFVGSVNLDGRSLFLNYELMTVFYDQADIARFAHWCESVRQAARLHQPHEPSLLRFVGEGLVLWLAFQL
ncbi:MAG: phospholipase D-like domain-containing protein [Quisquiliibacterium sp.]